MTFTGGVLRLQSGTSRLIEGGGLRLLEGGGNAITSTSLISDLFDTLCNIRRLAATKDDSYGPVADWPVLLADLPCNVGDMGGNQVMKLAQLGFTASKDVLIDYPGQEIRNGDAVEVDGSFLRVTHVDKRRELYSGEVALGLACEEYAP